MAAPVLEIVDTTCFQQQVILQPIQNVVEVCKEITLLIHH
jgi:hypothetical protein